MVIGTIKRDVERLIILRMLEYKMFVVSILLRVLLNLCITSYCSIFRKLYLFMQKDLLLFSNDKWNVFIYNPSA